METDSVKPDIGRKSVGTVLREVRESAGLTLDDAVRVTRIGKPYLVALEEGRFDRLPNEAYIKGFLRSYAAYLKVPEEEIIACYDQSVPGKSSSPAAVVPPSEERQSTEMKQRGQFKRIVPVIVLIVLVAAVSTYLFTVRSGNDVNVPVENKQSVADSVPVPGKAEIAEVPAPLGEETGKTDSAPEASDGTEKDSGSDKAAPLPDGLVLKIKVIADGWLDVTIDDAITQHYELKSGDQIAWKADKGFALDLSNAGGVEAQLNGKTLRPFGKSGESAHVVLNAGDAGE